MSFAKQRITPVVLAGGSGARLWPLSHPQNPKQFVLKSATGHSLFQETVRRVSARATFMPPLVVTNLRYEALVIDALSGIGCSDARAIYEPHARNTCPAIVLAALALAAQDGGAIMLVLPSDHHMDAPEQLISRLHTACDAAHEGRIVTFGIAATDAEVGYGYIARGAPLEGRESMHHIARFIEKPDATMAASLIAQGGYLWNSGMFLMRADVVLEEVQAHAPEILSACRDALATVDRSAKALYPEPRAMEYCPAMAFDRAVMERTTRGAVMGLDMGWRDLGTWESLAAHAHAMKASDTK